MTPNPISVLSEPQLQFRYGQTLSDPHDGLALFGPCDADAPSSPAGASYALIGTQGGIRAFERWSQTMVKAMSSGNRNQRLWPPFPGFESAFCAEWPATATWTYELEEPELTHAHKQHDPFQRAHQTVQMYLEGIRIARKRDEAFGTVVCVVPDEVWRHCRPLSSVDDPTGHRVGPKERRARRKGQRGLFGDFEPIQYLHSKDFRRQLKLRAMEYGIPVQIVRESTLSLDDDDRSRSLTPLSDRMWNLSTALYYKMGGKPWRLANAREGVCYIGLAYRRLSNADRDRTACCAALMFVDSGDGIVFMGEQGPWWSPKTKQFHLTRKAAYSLLRGTLQTYEQMEGRPLREVFLHARSGISNEEWSGFTEATPENTRMTAVRIRNEFRGLKAYREGRQPVLRGTFWPVQDRIGFLWTAGHKPRLGTYDGSEVPNPLRIDIQHGDADIQTVAHDIFGLTKLNYNACKLGHSQPVTILFSRAVGEIIVVEAPVESSRPNFKYYI